MQKWVKFGRWCKENGKKVKTSDYKMSKRKWFEKYGRTSDGKQWTYKQVKSKIIKSIPVRERWNFTFGSVVDNDDMNWNYKIRY